MNASASSCAATLDFAVAPVAATPTPIMGARNGAESLLVARLRSGDERAFDELVRKNHSALIRMAMGYVREREIAEEVVQDTWMSAIDALKRFEGRSSLRTWLFGILIHKAKDRGVRESRHVAFSAFAGSEDNDEAIDPSRFHSSGVDAGGWAFPPGLWDERTPEKLLASKQMFVALSQAVDELPTSLREVLVLKDVEGLDAKAICELLNITETNLYVRLHRARERVREAMEAAAPESTGTSTLARCKRARRMLD
jgi:RNA polymerase sigma-70 factor, ECF subfamily